MDILFSRHPVRKNATKIKKGSGIDIVAAPTFLGIPQKKFRDIIDDLPVHLWAHDENYTIVHANKKFQDKYDGSLGNLCHQCIKKSDHVCSCCISDQVLKINTSRKCNSCSCEGVMKNIHTFHRPIFRKNGTQYVLKSSIEMDSLFNELKDFEEERESQQEHISHEFWTMCASCKNIKDDKSKWINLENFLINYFNIIISHGICPDCIEKLYPEISRK